MEFHAPGVYVKEVPSAVQPIAGVGTSTAGIVGVVRDRITIPVPNPEFTGETEVMVAAAVGDLLGKILAEELTVPEKTLTQNTVLTATEVGAIKEAALTVTIEYEQNREDSLLDKTLAEDIKQNSEILIVTGDGIQIELLRGHKVVTGQVGAIRAALESAGIDQIRVWEDIDSSQVAVADLQEKTLAEDVTLPEATYAAGTEVDTEEQVQRMALGVSQVKVSVAPYLEVPFDLPDAAGTIKLCTNFGEFKTFFGDFSLDPDQCKLAHGVYGFFNNGGTRCYVMRYAKLTALQGPGALEPFEVVDEIALVAAPGITDETVQTNLLNHCENAEDRFAILDSEEDINDLTVAGINPPDNSDYGAFYLPWIQVFDPAKAMDPTSDGRIFVGPSGHLAGIYARVDSERGVHKAPANEVIRGALDLKYRISRAVQGSLNPQGLNCIRELNGNIRVWGARTLGGDANGEWKYVNVRRVFLFLRESIDAGTQWVVFEPNEPALWAKITRNVTAFLTNVWRSGALFGTTPEEAFYVKCDAETNPPEVRDAGRVVTEIGVAVVRPAEFVVFYISQWGGPGG